MAYSLDKPWIVQPHLAGLVLPADLWAQFGDGSQLHLHPGTKRNAGPATFTGTDNPPTIRALGSLTSGAIENQYWVSQVIFGFSIQNDSNAVIDAICHSFDQVQWYGGTAAAAIPWGSPTPPMNGPRVRNLDRGLDLYLKDFKNGQGGVPLTIRRAKANPVESGPQGGRNDLVSLG